jgi:hypothetical protein
VVTPSFATTNTQSFESLIFDLAIHVNTLLAPFGSTFVISFFKCTPWEDVSLRFDNDLKGFNANYLGGYRPMERDSVRLNPIRVVKATFDGSGDARVGLLM